jgi:hypothetical protein
MLNGSDTYWICDPCLDDIERDLLSDHVPPPLLSSEEANADLDKLLEL